MPLRVAAAAAMIALLAWSAPRHSAPRAVRLSGDATLRAFDAAPRAAGEILDRDLVTAAGAASIAAPSWSAALRAGAKIELLTQTAFGDLRRVLSLLAGSASLKGSWTLRAGDFLLRAETASVDVSVKDGLLVIDVADGGRVEIVGTVASLTLASGQKLQIAWDPAALTFKISVDEDAGSPIDVKIGKAVVQVDKGDSVSAAVSGDDLAVSVQSGEIKVLGPDGKVVPLGAGQSLTVPGGASGALQGRGSRRPVPPKNPQVPPEPKHRPVRDRTDISPS